MVESNYIKNKIKGKSFKNDSYLRYIEELVILEGCVLGTRGNGFADAQLVHMLKDKHKKEYEAILKELKPEEYKKYLEEQRKEKLEEEEFEKRFKQEEKKELETQKRWWKSMGGTL